MPVLTNCPHCLFPSVVRFHRRGKAQLCRQCGHGFVVSRNENRIRRLAASTNAELRELTHRRRQAKVWVINN